MFEKIKKKHVYKVFLYLFSYSLFTKILLTDRYLVFSIFTTLQLCIFPLDTQYSLDQVSVVSLSDFYQNLPLWLL